jgi:hypothetical protein
MFDKLVSLLITLSFANPLSSLQDAWQIDPDYFIARTDEKLYQSNALILRPLMNSPELEFETDNHIRHSGTVTNADRITYHPKLAELPNLAERASEGNSLLRFSEYIDGRPVTSNNYGSVNVPVESTYGIVYSGFFNNNHKPAEPTGDRAVNILGADIKVDSERVRIDSTEKSVKLTYEHTESPVGTVTLDYALMCIYKALGQDITDTYLYITPSTTGLDNTPITVARPVAKLTEVISPTDGLTYRVDENKLYNGWVFASRSNKEKYFSRAEIDGLIPNGKTQDGEISLVDLLPILQQAMYVYGEPHITEQEQLYLLQAYGANLPYFFGEESPAYKAAEYLMCRGITSPKFNFSQPLTRDVLFELLMKVKDKDSRETFKQINITADVDLLKKGIYPITLVSEQNPMRIVGTATTTTVSAYAQHFDYFVNGAFIINGKEDTPFVAEHTTNHSEVPAPMPGATYEGTSDGYMHFKISSRITGDVFINSTDANASPSQIKIESGGGYYNNGVRMSFPVGSHFKCKENPYGASKTIKESETSSEAEIKKQPMLSVPNSEVQPPDKTKVTYSVTIDLGKDFKDWKSLTWEGKPMFTENNGSVTSNDPTRFTYISPNTITISGMNTPYEYTTVFTSPANGGKFTCYAKRNNILYYPIQDEAEVFPFHAEDNAIDEVLFVSKGDKTVLISPQRNRVICGTTVFDIGGEPGSITFKDSNGKRYVDSRAFSNFTQDSFVLMSNPDTPSVVALLAKDDQNQTSDSTWQSCFINSGEATKLQVSKEGYIDLGNPFPLANFFVHREFDNIDATSSRDYLYSLTLKSFEGIKEVRTDFLNKFNITLPETIHIYGTRLFPVSTAEPTHNISFVKNVGYCFTPKDTDDTLIPIHKEGQNLVYTNENDSNTPAPIGVASLLLPKMLPDNTSTADKWFGTMHLSTIGADSNYVSYRLIGFARYAEDCTLAVYKDDSINNIPSEAFNKPALDTQIGNNKRLGSKSNLTGDSFMTNADIGLTVALLFALQIIPHILFFLLLVLLGLSLIAKFKPFQIFCHNHFDIYSFLTAGRQSVDTINIFKMTASIVIALSLLGLFQNGLILDVVSKITGLIVQLFTQR